MLTIPVAIPVAMTAIIAIIAYLAYGKQISVFMWGAIPMWMLYFMTNVYVMNFM